jgi:VWFA-related protein
MIEEGREMTYKRLIERKTFALALMGLFVCLAVSGTSAQEKSSNVSTDGRDVTVLVTVHPHDERTRGLAAKLTSDDFSVQEDKKPQRVLSAKQSAETPPTIAVLVQDDLVSRVSNEIKGLKEFIRQLPGGSKVMTGYISSGSLRVTQDFTSDLGHAAESLRAVVGSTSVSPYNPYVEVIEALKRFDSQPVGRRIILLVSDGLDTSQGFQNANPAQSLDLERAITEAQRRGVAVFTFYAPSAGLTSVSHLAVNFGQGSLNRLADETGGEAFFTGTDFVTFDPYIKEFKELLGRQWLITYRSTNTGSGFRRIQVTTDGDVPLYHPAGYRVRGG